MLTKFVNLFAARAFNVDLYGLDIFSSTTVDFEPRNV